MGCVKKKKKSETRSYGDFKLCTVTVSTFRNKRNTDVHAHSGCQRNLIHFVHKGYNHYSHSHN